MNDYLLFFLYRTRHNIPTHVHASRSSVIVPLQHNHDIIMIDDRNYRFQGVRTGILYSSARIFLPLKSGGNRAGCVKSHTLANECTTNL